MKSPIPLIAKSIVVAALLAGCGAGEEHSQLKMNAVTSDENNTVVRVRDGESTFFVYVTMDPTTSVKKGFRFECDTIPKLRRLIASTGFPTDFLNSTPLYDFDSQETQQLKLNENPRLSCNNPDKSFYKVAFADKTRYFFADNAKSKTRLYNIGCQSLVDSMGFKIDTATAITPDFITDLKIFTAQDADDISCIEGYEIDAKLAWTSGVTQSLVLKKAERLPLTTFSANKPDGSQAILSLTREGKCDWVESTQVNGALLITGQTPYDFQGKVACTLVVTAEAGTSKADSKTLTIQGQALPVESNGWIRDPKSDTGVGAALGEAGDGVCNGKEDCVYQDTRGRFWSKMDNTYRNYDDAQANCFNLVYGGYSDWHLPTVDELKQAFQDKIYDLRESSKLDLYSYSWSINAVPGDTTKAYFVSLTVGNELTISKSTVLMHTCTR